MTAIHRLPGAFARALRLLRTPFLVASASLAILAGSLPDAMAMDTDIFTALSTPGAAPNVLIILDNTSNWSRQNQHWAGGLSQGQSEASAIKSVIATLPGEINVGLMEFVTGGPSTDDGGYIRFAISPMGSAQGATATTNKANFSAALDTIYNNITSPNEKTNSGQAYGDLMWDAYNYLSGGTPFASSGDVVSSLADANGYTTKYTKFKSPLSDSTSCGNTYIIFIGNAPARGPTTDSATNLAALGTAGGDTSQIKMPVYSLTSQTTSTNLGYSSSCFASQPTGTPTDFTSTCTGYDSCTYSTSDTSNVLATCATGTQRYSVVSSTPSTTTSTTTTTATSTAPTTSCYSSASAWSSATDKGGLVCPTGSTTTSGSTTTITSYSCSYAINSTAVTPNTCAAITTPATAGATSSWVSDSTGCYSKLGTGNGQWNTGTGDFGTCKTATSSTDPTTGIVTNTTYTCTTPASGVLSSTTCSGGNRVSVTSTLTPYTSTSSPAARYTITQTATKTVQTVTQVAGTLSTLGNTLSCYSNISSCSTSDYASSCSGGACTCATPTTTAGTCPSGTRYQVLGNLTASVETPTGTFQTDTATYNSDEWARFLHNVGVPVGSSTQKVSTYTIDVYKDAPDATQSSLLASMARAGGGKYFTATNTQAIINALNSIFSEIQAVNSAFSSAALPISATNRAQNSNQVYIGMFRPDQTGKPRWFGNLKRYQVDSFNGDSNLGGADGKQAVSATTGFITPCAQSWWTADSGNYWYDVTKDIARIFITQSTVAGTTWSNAADDTNNAKGGCGTTGTWNDLPDGPIVEKGAAAEMLRQQSARTLYTTTTATAGPAAFSTFSTSTTGLSSNSTINTNIAKFIMGQDVTGEIASVASTAMRPSIHGEVIHSRPLPVDYGGTTGVVIYYGAGDGVYHAVAGNSGLEIWGLIAPESYPYLQRLMDNSPQIQTPYPTPPGQTAISGTTPKEFFFDGSTGLYQTSNNSKVWIFPGMRRGGRMLYGIDVTTPATPSLKWRVGCPNQSDDTGCTSGFSGIGQTWSTPQIATVNGYKVSGTLAPVVIVGGGYDTCEDADSTTPSCSSPKGAKAYVIDADTGALIKAFSTTRSVIADIALVDTNLDGVVDAAYVADTGGNIYRIDFPTTATSSSDWTMTKVAYTNVTPSNKYRKFEFAPAVLPYRNNVYVAIVSGDREHPLAASYPYTTPVVNRAYVYLDDPTRTTATDLDGSSMTAVSSASCTDPGILPGQSKVGWYLDLNKYGTGEQGVTSPLIVGGMVTFSTNRPLVSAASCTNSLGEARGYFMSLLNGSGSIGVDGTCGGDISKVFTGGGLPPSPVAATVSVNGSYQTIVIGAIGKDGTTSSPIAAQQVRPPISNKRSRTYWKINSDTK